MDEVVSTFEFQINAKEFLLLLCKSDANYSSCLEKILSSSFVSHEQRFLTFPSDADFLRNYIV